MKKRILTIGAYERDNFGDILFYLVLEYFCKHNNIELFASSYVESNMKDYFGMYVHSYHFLLSNYTFDSVWIVGGEVGACTIPMAFEMSINEKYNNIYTHLLSSMKTSVLKGFIKTEFDHLAYLPNVKKYNKNQNSVITINAIGGLEFLESFADSEVAQDTLLLLQGAHNLSVRSIESYEYLLSKNIKSNLVPDSVHAISLFYKPLSPLHGRYILFQINTLLFQHYGIDLITKSLVELIKIYNYPVYLFSAGTAPMHDSAEIYQNIKRHARDVYRENRIGIIDEKNTLKRVDWIAHSFLWVGSSLHGRIVSASYKVPRVSLVMEKVSNYSKKWDPLFPYDVAPTAMIEACRNALSVVLNSSYMESTSAYLAYLVKDNMERIVDTL